MGIMQDLSNFPVGSLLSQLVMDVYATDDEVTILYDRPFTEELLQLEFYPKTSELYFEFTPGKLPFGAKLKGQICDALKSSKTVTLIHMDIPSDTAVSGMEVPLSIL